MSQNKLGVKIMTKRLHVYCTIVMGLGSLALALPAAAQDDEAESKRPDREKADPRPPRPDGARERDRPRFQISPLLRALDANRDGKLDKSEIENAAAALNKLDRNEDGEITREELGGGTRPTGDRPRPNQPNPDRAAADLSSLDKDGDGKISKEEAPERMKERFDQVDRNGDGFIDKQEQEVILRFIRQRMQEGGGGGQRRPDRGAGEGGTDKPKRPALDES